MNYKFDFTFSPDSQKVKEIEWYDYKEGMKKAYENNKLALLVISAAWCHWCHVMDETTFSNDSLISKINTEMVAIRCDADLEPEIEARYAGEGLPAVFILSPHGITIGSGNFFTQHELLSLINEAQTFFETQRKYYFEKKEDFERNLEKIRSTKTTFEKDFDLETVVKDTIIQAVMNLDHEEVGFLGEGKFPFPEMVSFLFSIAEYENQEELLEMPSEILRAIVDNLFDKVEGGFFRYARMSDWSNPQTDKHLYDNSLMIELLCLGYRLTKDILFLNAAEMTIDFIDKNLRTPSGLYGFCVDANDEYYDKSAEERLFSSVKPRRILHPVSAYNLRFASSLIDAYLVTGKNMYLEIAQRIIDVLLKEPFFDEERNLLKRSPIKEGFLLQDSAELLNALLKCHQVTKKASLLEISKSIYESIVKSFYDHNKLSFKDRVLESDDLGALSINYHPLNENCLLARCIYYLSRQDSSLKNEIERAETVIRLYSENIENLGPNAGPIGLAALSALKAKEAN
ncbi:MAG: DUF255 domain-containing protein [Actinobacteria bacterium]|nr:DUF255 domain-containing protein [Actinomycetota bacterium]